MVEVELTRDDGQVVGWARRDPAEEPARSVVTRVEGAGPVEVARAAMAACPGHRLVVRGDRELAAGFDLAGASLTRASALMVLELPASITSDAPDVVLGPLRPSEAEAYAETMRRAYPPGHPDHDHGDVDLAVATTTIRSYLDGEVVGPLLADASAEARSASGELLGALFVGEYPPEDSFAGGPWITDVFVEPSAQGRGVGRHLLAHAVSALSAAGRPRLGLAVTLATPARALYEAVGFVELGSSHVFTAD